MTGVLFFDSSLKSLTVPDPHQAKIYLQNLTGAAAERGCIALSRYLKTADETGFLAAILDCSSFLREVTETCPEILESLFTAPLDMLLTQALEQISALGIDPEMTENRLMTELRRLKKTAHVLIALDDLAGFADVMQTTNRLSDLAEASLRAAVQFLLLESDAKGKLALPDRNDPEKDSGLIVLGMGKFGARELNYSSDIDLIIFIDSARPAITDPYECVDLFSRMARRLVKILQDRTADGYVFRVDLRLRPDPGATPLAIPVSAALHYYEGRGQNWERAAMIKARPVAGDIASGEQFIKELAPYVWRKYLDYAAIADIHSIKRQIHAHRGHGDIAVRGHNVKLGRGGIREIEFFVQTQQLIAGGRFPELRGSQTLAMLTKLYERGWVGENARDQLSRNYQFLRNVEHRIQMVADEQTHILPEDDEGFSRIASMMGYPDNESFTAEFLAVLRTVEKHYAALFEQAPELGSSGGNLVFTGETDDPDTLQTLSQLGFERPSDICRIIRTWHFGRYRATQTAEARERLTELTPALLNAFAATERADDALLRFDGFLQGLPSGIQLFSLLQSNPALLNLLVLVMSAAPRLAEIITRKPHVFDGMLDPRIFSELPTRSYLEERLDTFLTHDEPYEETLDRLRIFAAEQRFLIGIRLLTGAIDGVRAGRAFSDLAELMIDRALSAVMKEFTIRHGQIAGGRIAVLAMGKLGSRELTAGSDIDIILLYDHDADADYSDGEKQLAASQYYIRLTQRLIAALSAPMAEGVLYEVDMRLRPSGNKGPVATHIEAFGKYQRNDAWVWEHMALTRARAIAGDQSFRDEIDAEVDAILAIPSEVKKTAKEMTDMRALIASEKPPRDNWDLKLRSGGLIDLEFIAQFAVLTGQVATDIRHTSTELNLRHLKPDFSSPALAEELATAHHFYSNLTQIIRLCVDDNTGREDYLPGLLELLCRAAELPDIAHVEHQLDQTAEAVSKAFKQLLKG
ncbi:bifunctional [glutamine synthetase] adenylyltransferase/[glutamine synthetase]-adenylyl-L-tyrosine phosphorylase [Pseudochrobactrum algeriensis]|uniref:bifunctional [glutamine synthetase] adenylyltransferase/[glutamine synthetase]-adenylyl-L-tyrosine phosphorylase n=1 Tax=Pseudochrobactrum algeriensis TaxID=2834768 RepID=UPI001BCE4A35|nr:bifunctional [glutamine synthetase] adenylyltransferase/[glutamine synthetase]-adenylyl-L-tyrosine phosphorylase [Pseudochrobactrum algeriensis]QVQ37620.1 bifunctional [glutamine synthetase] adenylyltransferase/[glutamine synthetase]-adenylyl-L-tyrosine phosphorylase [Pseudochrobactrum algeriensis]QVQ40842.1 bifunctional [glutamine synthetase] adenylyltransferase/[glutamine synthetase]-adenylyl-L-tyrosine phosphorylase [Pseudochrobactrum algeriensis]QVQ44764.1 bifunctional [glutamine syntheta